MLIKSRFNENYIGAIFVPGGMRFVFVEMKDRVAQSLETLGPRHRVSKLLGHAIVVSFVTSAVAAAIEKKKHVNKQKTLLR